MNKYIQVKKELQNKMYPIEYDIVLFFGDNSSDFTGFDELSVQGRNQAAEEMYEVFGEKFIMFPNPISLPFLISFSCYVIYVTKNPLYLHPVVLLSIMLITIVGIILFSDFYDTIYMNYILLMGLFLYLILICSIMLNII